MKSILTILFITITILAQAQDIITQPTAKLGIGIPYCLACSPDGRYIATGGRKDVFLWDSQTKELIHTFSAHTAEITAITFSHDSRYLATAGWEGNAKIWDLETGEMVKEILYPGPISLLLFNPNDQILMASDYSISYFTEVSTGSRINKFTGAVHALSEDNQSALLSDWDTLYVKRMNGAQDHSFYTQGFVVMARFLDHDRQILYFTDLGVVTLLDVENVEELLKFSILAPGISYPENLTNFVVSPDGKMLFCSFNENSLAYVWDLTSGAMIYALDGHTAPIISLQLSADARQIFTLGEDCALNTWDIATGALLSSDLMHSGYLHVVWSPDSTTFLTGGNEKWVQEWDAQDFQPRRQFQGLNGGAGQIAYSQDGSLIAIACFDDHAYIFDNATGEKIQTLDYSDDINSIAFSPDASQILTGNQDGTAILWDIQSGQPIAQMDHPNVIYPHDLDYSSDGNLIATAGTNHEVRVWNAHTQELLYTLEGHEENFASVDFSPDNRSLVSSDNSGLVMIWDIQTGEQKKIFYDPALYMKINGPAIFSPDGLHIAWGMPGMEIHLLNVKTGAIERIFQITDYSQSWFFTSSLSFSPDGRYLVSGHQDGIARVWETGLASAITDWSVF